MQDALFELWVSGAASNCTNEEELRRIISDAGYIPAQRDTLYRSYALN